MYPVLADPSPPIYTIGYRVIAGNFLVTLGGEVDFSPDNSYVRRLAARTNID